MSRTRSRAGRAWHSIPSSEAAAGLSLVRARRFREVRRHVAYKLTALLAYRLEWPPGAREWLAGDDAGYISGAVIPVDGGLGMGH